MPDLAFPALLLVTGCVVALVVYSGAYALAWPFRRTPHRRFLAFTITFMVMAALAVAVAKHLGA